MLLRSSSAPILTSWLSYSKDSEREPEPLLSRTRSVSLSSSSFHSPTIDPTKTQVSLESDIKIQQKPRNKNLNLPIPQSLRKKSKTKAENFEEPEEEINPTSRSLFKTKRLLSSSGLGEKIMDGEDCGWGKKKESVLQTLVVGGGVVWGILAGRFVTAEVAGKDRTAEMDVGLVSLRLIIMEVGVPMLIIRR